MPKRIPSHKEELMLNLTAKSEGNRPPLPIADFRQKIIRTVTENQVTIITAETGAGKSTQVPQYLLSQGLSVIITQPRRIAARTISARVAQEYGCELGTVIGYRTAFERRDSPETRCLFCTDGLELVRELHYSRLPDVLIIDEVHEWNLNIETLAAWSKKQLAENPGFRVVIMSATLEAKRLSEFFNNAPVISVPGVLYPIEVRLPKFGDLIGEIADLAGEKRNVLVFLPGKQEIRKMIEELEQLNLEAIILPLHGELEPDEQDKVFKKYPLPKIVVATNVAQTSLTIEDVDAVVDSGLERRIETRDGIEGLYLRRTSEADDTQRKGRAGRCRPGIYINCYDGQDEQLEFPKAEIQRVRLDQMVLRLAIIGFDATELEFFHQPKKAMLLEAKKCLHALGAIDANEKVTRIGREMAHLPVSVNFARMIIEAVNLNVVGPVITIAACLEVDGITDSKKLALWQSLTEENESDLLAQLDVYNKAINFSDKEELAARGIRVKSFYRAIEIRRKLCETLINMARGKRIFIDFNSPGDKQKILNACIPGLVDHLYRINDYGLCKNGDQINRVLNRNSVLGGKGGWIVGLPLDLETRNRDGIVTKNLVTMATRVDPSVLADLAPHLFSVRKEICLSPYGGFLVIEHLNFGSQELPPREKQIFDWNELIREHLPADMTAEQLKNQFIREQLESENYFRTRRFEERPIQETLDIIKPFEFGRDPTTGEALKAFPGFARKFDSAVYYELKYYLSKEEADKSTAEALGSGKWTKKDKRWWECPDGHTTRASKNAPEVVCDTCRARHKI
ncbi:MAG: helicase-related protein [Patescibacteria group bacterium]|nr:helicase-related protein [Patescibacteria group bacterium]